MDNEIHKLRLPVAAQNSTLETPVVTPLSNMGPSPILGSLAVLQQFNYLTDTYLLPLANTLDCGKTTALRHLKNIQSIDGFTILALMWRAQIDPKTGEFTDGKEMYGKRQITKSWLSDRLIASTNNSGAPLLASTGGKYQKSATRVIEGAKAYSLVQEVTTAPNFRSNNKPLISTDRLTALMDNVENTAEDKQECFTAIDLERLFSAGGA